MTQLHGTSIDFQTISAWVDRLSQDYDYTLSKAFAALVLQKYLGLDDDEAEQAIVDGSNDGGIDAIHIAENEQGQKPTIYILQSKYYLNPDKFDRTFEGGALDKMAGAIEGLILKRPEHKAYINEKLANKLDDIRAILPQLPEIKIIFCSNSNPPNPAAIEKFSDYLDEINNGQDYFKAEYLHLREISKLLAPLKSKVIDAKLRLTGKYFTMEGGTARALVGRIQAKALAELRDKQGLELFDQNVRGYLSRTKNSINKKIFETASGEGSSSFFFLNNGITVVCKRLEYSIVDESPTVSLQDLQIVNGGQTTNSIFEAYRQGRLQDNTYVLIRVIETANNELLENITEATNSQTLVSARDLRSNDPVQKKIEAYMQPLGYYYEARKDKYADKRREVRVDAIKAAQSYFAFSLQRPAEARDKKRFLFGTFYEEIYNDQLDLETYLFSYLIHRQVIRWNNAVKDQYSFANYAELHTLAVMKGLVEPKLATMSHKGTLESAFDNILKATTEVVNEEAELRGANYSHRAFFVDPATLGRIKEKYAALVS